MSSCWVLLLFFFFNLEFVFCIRSLIFLTAALPMAENILWEEEGECAVGME